MSVGTKGARQFQGLFSVIPFKATVDFGSAGANDDATGFASANITVTGAELGDFVLLNGSIDLADTVLSGSVAAADTVQATIGNQTTAAVNHASMTVTGVVLKPNANVFSEL